MSTDKLAQVKSIIARMPKRKLAAVKDRIDAITKPRRTMLKGDRGDRGVQGDKGTDGVQGTKGIDGVQGPRGLDGAKGQDGLRGATGEPGRVGAEGAQGETGINWLGEWRRGTVYDIGDLVKVGEDVYLCIAANANEPATRIGWMKLSQRGAQGRGGVGGATGATGATGADGKLDDFARVVTVRSLTDGTAAQSVFATANDMITLAANKTYFFGGSYNITSGTVTHTTSISFLESSLGGGAGWNFTAIAYIGGGVQRSQESSSFISATGGAINLTNTAASWIIWFSGTVATTDTVDVTPQVKFSSAPGGINTVAVGSFIRFTQVGSNTAEFAGPWT